LIKEDAKPPNSVLPIAIGGAMPLKPSRKLGGFFMIKFLEKID
jgi:hypothetical protein